MQLATRERIKWTVLPGLLLAFLVSLAEVTVRWAHVDPLFPVLDAFEGQLRWIETLIWPHQWTLFSPTGRAILNGPPDWLAFVLFWGWWVLVPFAVGACVGEAVRSLSLGSPAVTWPSVLGLQQMWLTG